MQCSGTPTLRSLTWLTWTENSTFPGLLVSKSTSDPKKFEKNETLATEDATIVKNVDETIAVVDLTEMTVEGASIAMIEVTAQTETSGPTVATGIALNATTIILHSDMNAIGVVNHEATVADKTTTEVSNVANNDRALIVMNGRTTEWPVTGIVQNAIMITLLGGPNATNVVRQSQAVDKADLLEGMIEGHSKTVTDVVATEMVVTEEVGTIAVVEKPSTTTIGNAQNVKTQISLSDRNAIDVACHETVPKASHHVAMTGEVATEEVAIEVAAAGMRSHAGIASTAFKALSETGINIQMISTSEIKITIVIDENETDTAVTSLHKAFNLDS